VVYSKDGKYTPSILMATGEVGFLDKQLLTCSLPGSSQYYEWAAKSQVLATTEEDSMERIEATNPEQLTHHMISHSPENNPSIGAATVFAAGMTALLFSFLGLLIGLDRAPGSFYTYGLSCLFWPVTSMIALGALVGGSLGFVFGAIAHSSDEPTVTAVKVNASPISHSLVKSR